MVCNGFQSTILGPRNDVASVCHISGLADIEREQESLKVFMDAVESASIEQGDNPAFDVEKEYAKYICFGHDGWLVFDVEYAPRVDARVIIGSFGDGAWLTKPLQLAYGFREYFERSIVSAITYGTFDYDQMPFFTKIEDC